MKMTLSSDITLLPSLPDGAKIAKFIFVNQKKSKHWKFLSGNNAAPKTFELKGTTYVL